MRTNKRVVQLPFTPRPWQLPLIDDPSPRIICVVHRRAGKSTALLWRGIKRLLTIKRKQPRPRVVYLLPYAVQWVRTGLWDQLMDCAREIEGAEIRRGDKQIVMPNGGVFQTGGSDNPDVWRGGGADEAICDEFDDMEQPGLVPLVLEPMLADRNGTLLLSGTPKGRNRLRDRWTSAEHADDWSRTLLTWRDTGIFNQDQIDRLKREMTDEEFAQELECSFDSPHSGSIWGRHMAQAQADGRVTRVPWEPSLPVHTAWDLGRRHATVIWFAQFVHAEVRIIDVMAVVGGDMSAFVRALHLRPYVYGKHYLPHDVRVGELGTGKTRLETLQSLGIRATVVPNIAKADGMSAVAQMLPRCWFNTNPPAAGDEEPMQRMETAVKALFEYHREWNEKLGVFRLDVVDDWTADYADAFRMLAVGSRKNANEGPRGPFVARVGALT